MKYWNPKENYIIVFSDETALPRTEEELECMVNEMRIIAKKYGFDSSMFGGEKNIKKLYVKEFYNSQFEYFYTNIDTHILEDFDIISTSGPCKIIPKKSNKLIKKKNKIEFEEETIKEMLWSLALSDHVGDVSESIAPLLAAFNINRVFSIYGGDLVDELRRLGLQPEYAKENDDDTDDKQE